MGSICACDRAWMTKLVKPSDVGKAFAFFGLFQAICPLIATPLIGVIYGEISEVPHTPHYLLDITLQISNISAQNTNCLDLFSSPRGALAFDEYDHRNSRLKNVHNPALPQVYPDYGDDQSLLRGLVGGAWLLPVVLLLSSSTIVTTVLHLRRDRQETTEIVVKI